MEPSAAMSPNESNLGSDIFRQKHSRALTWLTEEFLKTRKSLPNAVEFNLKVRLRDLYFDLFLSKNGESDLVKALEYGQTVVESLALGIYTRLSHLDRLSFMKLSAYHLSGRSHFMDEAIELGREAQSLLLPLDPHSFEVLHNLGYNLSARYKVSKNLPDLDEAIRCSYMSLEPKLGGNKVMAMSNLSARLCMRFVETKNLEDCKEAERLSDMIISVTKPGELAHGAALTVRCHLASDRFDQTGLWRDLEEAIRLVKLSIASLSEAQEGTGDLIASAARLLSTKYDQTKDPSDRVAMLEMSKRSVTMLHPDHALHSSTLAEHLNRVKAIADVTFDPKDLDLLLGQCTELLMDGPSPGDKNYLIFGELLSRRYEVTGIPMHLVELLTHAISCAVKPQAKKDESDGESTIDSRMCLLAMYTKVGKLATSPPENNIVAQVSNAMHKEYLQRVRELGFIDTLVALQRDVIINAEIVMIAPRAGDISEKELNDAIEFAQSIGAKTYQMRIKMPWLQIRPGNPKVEELSSDLDETSSSQQAGLSLIELEKKGQLAADRFKKGKRMEDLDKAVQIRKTLFDAQMKNRIVPEDHWESFWELLMANETALQKYCDMSVECLTKCPPVYWCDLQIRQFNNRLRLLSTTAEGLRLRFLASSRRQDLFNAVLLSQRAVALSEVTRKHDKADLTLSQKDARAVIEEREYGSTAFWTLAISLKARFQVDGNPVDLEAAIENMQKAVALISMVPEQSRGNIFTSAFYASRLGLMLRLRFQMQGELKDLEVGIAGMEMELKRMEEQKHSAMRQNALLELLNNLGLAYQTKYERTRNAFDNESAVTYCRKACDRFSTDPQFGFGIMCNLSNALNLKFKRTRRLDDLEEAVKLTLKVVAGVNSSHPGRAQVLMDSSEVLMDSFRYTSNLEHLEMASRYAKESIRIMPPASQLFSSLYLEYGAILESQFRLAGKGTLEDAIGAYLKAWSYKSGKPESRIQAVKKAAQLLSETRKFSDAQPLFQSAVDYMPALCSRWLLTSDRQALVSMFNGIPNDAAASLIQKSSSQVSIYDAICCLEVGRGIIHGTAIEWRSESRKLENASTTLYKEYNTLRSELDVLSRSGTTPAHALRRHEVESMMEKLTSLVRQIPGLGHFSPPLALGSMLAYDLERSSPELFRAYNRLQTELNALPQDRIGLQHTKKQRELSTQMESVVSQIRGLAGMEDFLQAPKLADILKMAYNGPIVIVNSSESLGRSDAIIIQPSGLDVVHLTDLHFSVVREKMKEMETVMSSVWTLRTFGKHNKWMTEFLRWLWVSVVKPVLARLGIKSQLESLPVTHIHWIGTGLLSWAPFHAAGIHTEDSDENTMSYAISSYAPTLRALEFAREERTSRTYSSQKSHSRLLLVSASHVAGQADLDAVSDEISCIKIISENKLTTICLPDATVESVITELPMANLVHFACHGSSDLNNPDSSHLLLHASEDTDAGAPLSVQEISARKSAAAELVYLSACSAAENRSPYLADEAIHIASAFLVAGFRNVVATLWQSRDVLCKDLATEFYKELLDGKNEDWMVAEALHKAVLKVRDNLRGKPLAWAGFVHFGA